MAQNELFSYQSKFSVFFMLSKQYLLTTVPKNFAPPKHEKKRGFSKPKKPKQLTVTKRPFLEQKRPKSEIPAIICFVLFFSLNNKNTKHCWHPYFYSVLTESKKEAIFQKLNLKQGDLEKKTFAPNFWKRYFWKMSLTTGPPTPNKW